MTLAHASTAPGHGMIATLRDRMGGLGRLVDVVRQRTLAALSAKASVAMARTTVRRVDLPGADRSVTMAPAPLSNADQWHRVVRPLEAAAGHAQAMGDLHAAASRQLCSVDYALEQLIDDLSAIMTVPRAPRASVHELRPIGPVRFSDAQHLDTSMAA